MSISSIDDQQLIRLALSGRQEGYSRLLFKHQGKVLLFITKLVGQTSDAEDLLLVSFDKAFRNLQHYNSQYAFTTWMYNIAQNVCIDYLRKKKQRFISLDDVKEICSDSAEDSLSPDQTDELFSQFIKTLKPIYRKVALLRYYDDYAYEDIASSLDLPIGTVKTRIHRIKELLNKYIADNT